MENEKPLTPAEFFAVAKALKPDLEPYLIDRGYFAMPVVFYTYKPQSPSEALQVVHNALVNAGVPF